jgi:outer membrane biosynthesis protein TonB
MSERRRRRIKNDDTDDDESNDDDEDNNDDTESEYSEIEEESEEELNNVVKGNIDKEEKEEKATAPAIAIIQKKDYEDDVQQNATNDTRNKNVEQAPVATQNKPKEILKRVSTNEEQQEKDKRDRERNSRNKAQKREQTDSFSQQQRKNPAYVPLSGNFFLHDDRDSNQLVEDEDDRETGLATLTEANLSKHTEGNLNRPSHAQEMQLQRTRSLLRLS